MKRITIVIAAILHAAFWLWVLFWCAGGTWEGLFFLLALIGISIVIQEM